MIAVAPEITAAIDCDAPVAIGVSGGKDSCALAIEVVRWLNAVGHIGPRVLVHADLGRVEWKDSAPTCERLAQHLGLELLTVRRKAGDMMDRWLVRWENNKQRYANLECVKVILPWSTASMRFCTSELKTDIITRALTQRFPGRTIISASGIRRQESPNRAKAPVSKANAKLTSKAHATTGFDWHPIIDYTEVEVFDVMREANFRPHEAYSLYNSSRVSCAFCILGSKSDLVASATCPDNQDIYREMVGLEITSTFSFQGGAKGWLGDVAPHLLTKHELVKLAYAKEKAKLREATEVLIPKHLLYTAGRPTQIPTDIEATRLASDRRFIGDLLGIDNMRYTDAGAILARYQELMRA